MVDLYMKESAPWLTGSFAMPAAENPNYRLSMKHSRAAYAIVRFAGVRLWMPAEENPHLRWS
jgi:hypothetical protein